MQTTTIGLAATPAGTLPAALAPSWTNSRALDADRFQTVRRCPALTKERATAEPMRPSPRLEISLMLGLRARRQPARYPAADEKGSQLPPPILTLTGASLIMERRPW